MTPEQEQFAIELSDEAREFDTGLDAIHTLKEIRGISSDTALTTLQRQIHTDITWSQFFARHPECDEPERNEEIEKAGR